MKDMVNLRRNLRRYKKDLREARGLAKDYEGMYRIANAHDEEIRLALELVCNAIPKELLKTGIASNEPVWFIMEARRKMEVIK